MNRKPEQILDEFLVLQAQKGDSKSIELLVKQWHSRFVRYSVQITSDPDAAADAVQESWISIMKGIRKINDPANFKSWAYRIVHNRSYDVIRKTIRRKSVREDFAQIAMANHEDDSDSLSDAGNPKSETDDVDVLRSAIDELKPVDRLILTLFYEEELSLKEIQGVMGTSISSLKSRLYYVRKRLKKILERKNDG